MGGKVVNLGDYRKGGGPDEEEGKGTHDPAEVVGVPGIDPEVIAQILVIRKNVYLSDASLDNAGQSVSGVDLPTLTRWLRFADSGKIRKKPSFYICVLERFIELSPNLSGFFEEAKKRLHELDKLGDKNLKVTERVDALRLVVQRLALEQIGKNLPKEE